jgi:hypothetical protein
MSEGVYIVVWIWSIVALLAHVVVCVTTNWAAMLIIGIVFFPVGILHGTGIMLGLW